MEDLRNISLTRTIGKRLHSLPFSQYIIYSFCLFSHYYICALLVLHICNLLAEKLLLSPSQFKSSECLDELIKLNSILNIKTADLIFFPVIIQRHWVLMCLNVLHSNLNLFDSLNLTPPEDSERMLKNLK